MPNPGEMAFLEGKCNELEYVGQKLPWIERQGLLMVSMPTPGAEDVSIPDI